jgi:streptogramin lyase
MCSWYLPLIGRRGTFLTKGDDMEYGKKFYLKSLIIIAVLSISHILACSAGAVVINEYSLPAPKSGPVGITNGPDGALWFLEYYGNKIGRIDPTTHAITEYTIPTAKSGVNIGITSGPDGAIWFTETGSGDAADGADQIGRIDLTTHEITEYPLTKGSGPAYITTGPDGALWFTEQFTNQIGRIDPTTHVITEYPTPSGSPWGITLGPDGALWFNECDENNLVRIDPTTHAMTEYHADGVCGGMAAGPDNAVWFTAHQHDKIGRIDMTTFAVTEYSVPTSNSNTDIITCGPDGALWFTETKANKTGRIDPTTFVITEYPVPKSGSFPAAITSGPDGNVWFAEAYGNKIGQIVLASAPDAPTNVTATATGVGQVTVGFTAPASNGGSAIAGYSVTSNPAGGSDANAGSTSLSHVVTNLKNGTNYTFAVTATNAKGLSTTSKRSNKVKTWAAPGQPAITSLTAGNAAVTVKFSAPKSDGGSPITGYSVVSSPAGGNDTNAGSPSLSHLVDNLANGTPYKFTATATNAVGSSTSRMSKAIIPATVPDPPTNVTATAGKNKGTVVVTFDPPATNGGAAIKKYTVTAVSGGNITKTGKSVSIALKGLTSGVSYTFEVKATNAKGDSAYSAASNPVVPN